MSSAQHQAAASALAGAKLSVAEVRIPDSEGGHVPATPGQWRAVLSDAGLVLLWEELLELRAELHALECAPVAEVGARVIGSVCRVRDRAKQLVANLEASAWFRAPSDSEVTPAMLVNLAHAAADVARQAAADPFAEPVAARETGSAVVGAIEKEVVRPATDPPSVVVTEVFRLQGGLPEGVSTLTGSAKLTVASPLTPSELEHVSRTVLAHLILPGADYAPSATGVLVHLLLADRPLCAHVAALHARDRLLELDPDRVGEVLAEHRARLPENWASHRAFVHGLERRAAAGDDDEEVALAEAELYGIATEGPVRRSGWTILRLGGAEGPLPKLGELHDRLRAEDYPLASFFADAIESRWRNSVAHRDAHFDGVVGQLVLDGAAVDPNSLRLRRDIGTATCAGLEAGIALARAGSRDLQRAISLVTPASTHSQIARSRLADVMARHGLTTTEITISADKVTLRFADGNAYTAGQVIAELGGVSRELKLDRVELVFGERPPLTVSARTLAAVRRLRRSTGVPATALWPVVAEGRQEDGVDPTAVYEEIANRASWQAARLLAPMVKRDLDLPLLSRRKAAAELGEILDGLTVAWRVLPGRAPTAHARVPQLLRQARGALVKAHDLAAIKRVGSELVEKTPREGAPDLPWFAPMAEAEDADAA